MLEAQGRSPDVQTTRQYPNNPDTPLAAIRLVLTFQYPTCIVQLPHSGFTSFAPIVANKQRSRWPMIYCNFSLHIRPRGSPLPVHVSAKSKKQLCLRARIMKRISNSCAFQKTTVVLLLPPPPPSPIQTNKFASGSSWRFLF